MQSQTKTTAILAAASLTAALAIFAQGQAGRGVTQPTQQGGQPQVQQQTQLPGIVTGTVVNAKSGEPLRKATVTLRPSGGAGRGGGPASGTSDNSGGFRITGVPPGTYTMIGERTGFVQGAYGVDRPGQQARTLEVTSNQTTGGIQLKLTPQGVLVGRVFDQDGDPVQNAQVQVMRYTYPRGGKQLTPQASAGTNDLGEYRIAGLAPGRYYVSANAPRNAIELILARGAGGGKGALKGIFGPGGADTQAAPDPEAYVTTYYPRTLDSGTATPLDIVAGSEMRGIDIGLLKRQTYKVTGVIDGVPLSALQPPTADPNAQQNGKGKAKGGGGRGGFGVNLIPRALPGGLGGGQDIRVAAGLLGQVAQAQVNPQTGAFQFQGVQPGAYYLIGQTRGPGQQDQLTGRLAVDVATGDVGNLTLRLQGPVEVKGKIMPEKADTAFNSTALRLNMNPAIPMPGGGGGQQGRIEIAADGTFTTKLAANTYNVQVAGAPQGYYLKAVKVSGREAPDAVLDLNFNGGPLEIVMANDAGNITGRVQRTNGDPVPNVRVTAVPVNGSSRQDYYKAANSFTDGTFTLSGLPPGNYRVFAWEEIEGQAWMDPDFRKPFEPLAETTTIANSLSPSVNVKLIGREQMVLAGVQ